MNTQYVTNDKGENVAVILPIEDYERMIEEIEELEDIRLYDEARSSKEPSIPIDEAFRQIEKSRKN